MAGKFSVNISGGSGSIIMGDNTFVNIKNIPGIGGRPVHEVIRRDVPRGTRPVQANQVLAQETGDDVRDSDHKFKITQGYALIIHNERFPNMPDRTGSHIDREAIKQFCRSAGMIVNDTTRKTENITADEMEQLFTEISKRDFGEYNGFVCFILSHGCASGIYGVDAGIVPVEKIVTLFKKNAGLVGKPKLFFIQACRGNNRDYGVEADSPSDSGASMPPLRLPTDSDTLVAYSSVEGYESYRMPKEGSWFIMTLIEKLKQHGHNMHLIDILTLVNHEVAQKMSEKGLKQMPCQTTTLTKFVFFKLPPPLPTESAK